MKHERGPNMLALLAERKPGCCAACDAPLPPLSETWMAKWGRRRRKGKRERVLCGSVDCERVYQTAYGQDRRIRERKPGTPTRKRAA